MIVSRVFPASRQIPVWTATSLLGGVFVRFYPLNPSRNDKKLTIFADDLDPHKEKSRLQQVYSFFRESWGLLSYKSQNDPDLITIGTGISRLDLSGLYTRSMINSIDNIPNLYETYMKTKIVDLSEAGIPYMNRNRPRLLYPVSTNSLAARFNLETNRKDTGKTVWEMADAGDFKGIEARTESEVGVLRMLYDAMVNKIFE